MAESKEKTNSNTWNAISYGADALGQLFKGGSDYYSGKYSGTMLGINARFKDVSADDILLKGASDESAYRLQGKKILASQKAGIADSGFNVNSGTALDVFEQSARILENDALTIRRNAEKEAISMQLQAEQDRINQFLANRQATTSLLNATSSSLMTGAEAMAGVKK